MATNNRKSVAPPEVTPEIESKAQELGSKAAEKAPKSGIKTTNEPTPVTESVYHAAELARAHKTFNTSYEIVAVALKLAKVEKATVAQAKEIIEKFKNKEVK